jgi:signal transduction histidine kinase
VYEKLVEDVKNCTVTLAAAVRQLHDEVQRRLQVEQSLRCERRTLRRLLWSSENERRWVSYEIHDGLAQHLAAAIMHLQVFETQRGSQGRHRQSPLAADEAYKKGMTLLRQSFHDARQLIGRLRPPVLDEQGIEAAIAQLIQACQGPGAPQIEFRSDIASGRLDPTLENAIYRIAQEALANACKHSKSKRVRIWLGQQGPEDDRCVRMAILDWGVGFDPGKPTQGHFGLEGIRQRARLLGGRATIESSPGRGTRILVELPGIDRIAEDDLTAAR